MRFLDRLMGKKAVEGNSPAPGVGKKTLEASSTAPEVGRKAVEGSPTAAGGSISLHEAAKHGHIDEARKLLRQPSDIRALDAKGRTPLFLAIEAGHTDMVSLLLDAGADSRGFPGRQDTPLHLAAAAGAYETTKLLLGHGADQSATDDRGRTPLFEAVTPMRLRSGGYRSIGYQEDNARAKNVAQLLLASGADVNARDNQQNTPLHEAIEWNGCNLEALRLLIDSGADVNAMNKDGISPLHLASYACNLDAVRVLVENGALVGLADKAGQTAFARAIDPFQSPWPSQKLQREVISLLIDAGADVNCTICASFGAGIKDRLLRDAKDCSHFETPLVSLARHLRTESVELLLAKGADANSTSQGWEGALTAAARGGAADIVTLLLNHGADVNAINKAGKTAFDCAVQFGYTEVCRLLRERGADTHELAPQMTTSASAESPVNESMPTPEVDAWFCAILQRNEVIRFGNRDYADPIGYFWWDDEVGSWKLNGLRSPGEYVVVELGRGMVEVNTLGLVEVKAQVFALPTSKTQLSGNVKLREVALSRSQCAGVIGSLSAGNPYMWRNATESAKQRLSADYNQS